MEYVPFRKNMRVADACERICPPMGLRAPPATKVMVAPGSAMQNVNMGVRRECDSLTLNLVGQKNSNLRKG